MPLRQTANSTLNVIKFCRTPQPLRSLEVITCSSIAVDISTSFQQPSLSNPVCSKDDLDFLLTEKYDTDIEVVLIHQLFQKIQ